MSGDFGLERRQDQRLRRFGLILGLLLAVAFHAVLFWGPRVRYRPLLEEAQVRRVLVAHPYQPAPAPPPPRPAETPAERRPPAPDQAAPAPAAPVAPPPPAQGGGQEFRKGVVERPAADAGLATAAVPQPEPAPGKARNASSDEWTAVLAELRSRGATLEEKERLRDQQSSAGGTGGTEQETDGGTAGYLDPRIRITVASYPPTSVETAHPTIAYPDLRFHRKQLQAGICRVYYRVWTDGRGTVVRSQLKYPTTREEQDRYEPFVRAVQGAVKEWPFDRTEAEVHVDVYFEIE